MPKGYTWTATYSLHDGERRRTVNAEGEPATLRVEILSNKGEIGITVTDDAGNVIFSRDKIETSSFDILIPGKVTVKITGEDHSGSFSISW